MTRRPRYSTDRHEHDLPAENDEHGQRTAIISVVRRKGGYYMDLPIRFPSEAEVIDEDVARFRRCRPRIGYWSWTRCFDLYHFLAERSSKPDALARFAREDEERGRAAVEEFVRRHG